MGRILLLIIFLMNNAWAEIIGPIPLENQFRNVSAIIHAIYKGSSPKKMPNDVIVTEFSFKILDSVGIDDVRMINKNHFTVFSQGGIWHGLVYNPVSRIKFTPGEEVILLLKNVKNGYEVIYQGLGKYKILTEKDEVFLSSSKFPEHPKLGKIKVAEFNQLVKKKFGKNLLGLEAGSINFDNMQASAEKKKEPQTRKIASTSQTFYSDESMLFIILFMGILGAVGHKMGQSL